VYCVCGLLVEKVSAPCLCFLQLGPASPRRDGIALGPARLQSENGRTHHPTARQNTWIVFSGLVSHSLQLGASHRAFKSGPEYQTGEANSRRCLCSTGSCELTGSIDHSSSMASNSHDVINSQHVCRGPRFTRIPSGLSHCLVPRRGSGLSRSILALGPRERK
jgi:hypothetical protein